MIFHNLEINTINDAVKIFVPSMLSFCIGLILSPQITKYLYKWKLWKKSSVKMSVDGKVATITNSLHNDEERKTPRMGGLVVSLTVLVTTILLLMIAIFIPSASTEKLSFLSRNQTWLPLFTLLVASLAGLIDDYLVVNEKGKYAGGGMSLGRRLLIITLLSLAGAWWFYVKLGISSIHIPFDGELMLGIMFIPFFMLVMLAVYSGGIIDGVDGLSGGIFAMMFSAYAVIAYSNSQIDLAAFCMVVVGAILVFLWFNIPPARYFFGETGTMGLTTTLAVIAFLTGRVLLLPIIALPLLLTTLSVIIQLLSKKFRNGKKVFLVAPLHNHFIAKGWPPHKVTMRYWVFGAMCAVLGIVLSLIS